MKSKIKYNYSHLHNYLLLLFITRINKYEYKENKDINKIFIILYSLFGMLKKNSNIPSIIDESN